VERRAVRIVITLASLVFALASVGWLAFVLLEHMSPGDALGSVVNILSTVGLGDIPAVSPAGRVVVGILQFGAVSIVAVAIATLAEVMTRGAIRQYMGRYRMDERIKNLRNHFIVVGYSLTGENLTRDLAAEGQAFVVVEKDPEIITRMEERGLLFVEGDAIREDILKKAGIERARGLFAVLSSDSDNLMVVLSARGLNDKVMIVSRATREDFVSRFLRAGANAAMSPQEWASRQMIQAVLRPSLLRLLSSLLDPTVSDAYLDEAKVPFGSPVVGKTLADSGIRHASGIVVLGIVRSDGTLDSSVGPGSVIQENDVLIGYGHRENFARLAEVLRQG
jgi:voltage-gated potassium channel